MQCIVVLVLHHSEFVILGNTHNTVSFYKTKDSLHCNLYFWITQVAITSLKEQRMWLSYATLFKLKASKRRSISVQFPPYLRWCLTSLDDRQTGHNGCHRNWSSSELAVVIYVLLISTEWEVYCAQEMRIKLWGHIWSDRLNVLWLKVTCGLKLNNSCHNFKFNF